MAIQEAHPAVPAVTRTVREVRPAVIVLLRPEEEVQVPVQAAAFLVRLRLAVAAAYRVPAALLLLVPAAASHVRAHLAPTAVEPAG